MDESLTTTTPLTKLRGCFYGISDKLFWVVKIKMTVGGVNLIMFTSRKKRLFYKFQVTRKKL